jgi:hypothetical protein
MYILRIPCHVMGALPDDSHVVVNKQQQKSKKESIPKK